MTQRLLALEKAILSLTPGQTGDESNGRIALSATHPDVTVDMAELRSKLSAATDLGKIKGVYDLLAKKEDQARWSGKGRGKFVPVPDEIFVPMKNFFRARFKRDPSRSLLKRSTRKVHRLVWTSKGESRLTFEESDMFEEEEKTSFV